MPLITAPELATWAQLDESNFSDFEEMVIEKAQYLVADEAGHPEWVVEDIATVPYRARIICLNLARRTLKNPDQIVQEGGIGPIGGDRVRDSAAMAMELSPAEKEELHGLRGDGTTPPGLWVQPLGEGLPTLGTTAYVPDISGSDWLVPFGTLGDVGEPGADGVF